MEVDFVKLALVVGGAECVSEDIKKALELFSPDIWYAANDIGAHIEKLDIWCTLHPEFMDGWEKKRKDRGLPNGYSIVAPPACEVGMHGQKGRVARRVTYRWPGMKSSASSGIYAAKVAIEDGCHVVLAGIPMDASDNFERRKPWSQLNAFVTGFNNAIPYMIGHTRSMSGKTRDVFGFPDGEWLRGEG